MPAVIVAALLLAQRPKPTDAQLRAACASVQTHIGDYDDGHAPKAWKTIAAIPSPERITRLTRLLHQHPTATEYAGICYALGISGYKTAEMTKRLMSFTCNEIPTPTEKDDEDVEIGTDIDQLYHHFPTDETLAAILECQGDGTGADYTSDLARALLADHPKQVMRVAKSKHLEDTIANNLWYESAAKETNKTNAILQKLARDPDPEISNTAIKIAREFIQEYNDNYGGDPGQPKLHDWTAKRSKHHHA